MSARVGSYTQEFSTTVNLIRREGGSDDRGRYGIDLEIGFI